MAQDPQSELTLTSIDAKSVTIRQLLTTFHHLFVFLDPYTRESAWILPTAMRTLRNFQQADCRVSIVITAEADAAKEFLGKVVENTRVYVDPNYEIAKGFGLDETPAIVVLGQDGTIRAATQGWAAGQWQRVTDTLATLTSWRGPQFPDADDPGPFPGSSIDQSPAS